MVLFKEKSCSRKNGHTAEVLVFEQNMLKKRSHRYGKEKSCSKKKPPLKFWCLNKTCSKKSGHTAMVLFRKKTCRKNKQPSPKHVCLVHWHKKMHQNKKRPHRYAFLSHQKRAKIKSEHAATGARSSLIF